MLIARGARLRPDRSSRPVDQLVDAFRTCDVVTLESDFWRFYLLRP